MGNPVYTGTSLLTGPLEADQYVLSQLLEDAVNSKPPLPVSWRPPSFPTAKPNWPVL
jgi:hypothetical protein